jgi:hypothetical protein
MVHRKRFYYHDNYRYYFTASSFGGQSDFLHEATRRRKSVEAQPNSGM